MTSATWDWSLTRLLFLDCETSDLVRIGRPLPQLLEIAAVLTDGELHELGRFEAVIRHDRVVLDALDMPRLVVEMHTKNGLLEALRDTGTVSVSEAEHELNSLLDRFDLGCEHPVVLAGFSPSSVDRPVVAGYMPSFHSRFHHRLLDMSAVKLAMRNWGGVALEREDPELHRAMADVMASVRMARSVRRALAAAAVEPSLIRR